MKHKNILLVVFMALFVACGNFSPQQTSHSTATSAPTFIRVPQTPTASPTEPPTPTTAPVTAQGKQPPACTFPLAQITTVKSKSENYTFLEPKVVLTAGTDDGTVSIFEWLPDNQRALITQEFRGNTQQNIELFNPQTGKRQVYATRNRIDQPPSWMAKLNAVVYPMMNITKVDKIHHSIEFTRQAWVSEGNPDSVRMIADNMAQFYIAVKPDGSQVAYQSDNQLTT